MEVQSCIFSFVLITRQLGGDVKAVVVPFYCFKNKLPPPEPASISKQKGDGCHFVGCSKFLSYHFVCPWQPEEPHWGGANFSGV